MPINIAKTLNMYPTKTVLGKFKNDVRLPSSSQLPQSASCNMSGISQSHTNSIMYNTKYK